MIRLALLLTIFALVGCEERPLTEGIKSPTPIAAGGGSVIFGVADWLAGIGAVLLSLGVLATLACFIVPSLAIFRRWIWAAPAVGFGAIVAASVLHWVGDNWGLVMALGICSSVLAGAVYLWLVKVKAIETLLARFGFKIDLNRDGKIGDVVTVRMEEGEP